jgi:hypothetical protein
MIFENPKTVYSPIIDEAETMNVKKMAFARGLFQNSPLAKFRATR